jgi:hypothetical protein
MWVNVYVTGMFATLEGSRVIPITLSDVAGNFEKSATPDWQAQQFEN